MSPHYTAHGFPCAPGNRMGVCIRAPYQVLTETIPLDPAFEEALNDRLVLIFTGKQRLAR